MADKKSKVVPLRSGASSAGITSPALSALVQCASGFLKKSLRDVFDELDDTFFDMADKAESSRQQTLFFDAMRAIRMERKSIERRFFQQIEQRFLVEKSSSRLADGAPGAMRRNTINDLQSMGNEHLEEMVAFDTMVSKCLERISQPLDELSGRLSRLLPRQFTLQTNPYGPEVLSDFFSSSTKQLDIDIRSKLVLYKLFERKVLMRLDELYARANKVLDEQGIAARQKSVEIRQPVSQPKKTGTPGRVVDAGFSAVDATSRGDSPQQQITSPYSSGPGPKGGVDGRESRLIRRLTRLMGQPESSGHNSSQGEYEASVDELLEQLEDIQEGFGRLSGEAIGKINLAEVLENQLRNRPGKPPARLHQEDRQIARLVDNTLDYFDHSAAVPEDLYRLVQRLKLPLLKIALKDASFFDKEKHPARRLLSEVAQLSVRFEQGISEEKDPLYMQIEQLTSKLATTRGTLDQEALTAIFADFLAEVDRYDCRIKAQEKRILDEAEAAERINEAHTHVVHALGKRLKDRELPRALFDLAEQAWSKVMFLCYLKAGADSDDWRDSLALFEELANAASAGDVCSGPGVALLQQIRRRLNHAAFDIHKLDVLLSRLRDATDKQVLVAPFHPDIPGEVVELCNDSVVNAAQSQLDDIEQGIWFDFVNDEHVHQRCKLAGILKPYSKYVFVNRQGCKAVTLPQMRVVEKIRDKALRRLDNQQLFDRSLDKVIEQLKQDQSAPVH